MPTGLPNSQANMPDDLDPDKHENIYEKPLTADATCFSQTVQDKQLWMVDLYLGFFSFTLFFFFSRTGLSIRELWQTLKNVKHL